MVKVGSAVVGRVPAGSPERATRLAPSAELVVEVVGGKAPRATVFRYHGEQLGAVALDPGEPVAACWSPNSRRVLVVQNADGDSQVTVITLDGGVNDVMPVEIEAGVTVDDGAWVDDDRVLLSGRVDGSAWAQVRGLDGAHDCVPVQVARRAVHVSSASGARLAISLADKRDDTGLSTFGIGAWLATERARAIRGGRHRQPE